MDTLYGGQNGQIQTELFDKNLTSLPDSKWSPSERLNITSDDVIPSHQAALFAVQNDEVDIRPRFF